MGPGIWAVAVGLETVLTSFPEVDPSEFGHQVDMSYKRKKHLKAHNKQETPQTTEPTEMRYGERAGSAQ